MPLRKNFIALLLLAFCHGYAKERIHSNDSSTVTITLQNASDKLSKIDSVFVIFDRFDLRGAGIIKQVFYPDTDNQIHVSLPKGKYYINIYCLGIYNKEGFDRIVSTKPNKDHKILLRLQESALFELGLAQMPDDHFDPAHLAILNFSNR